MLPINRPILLISIISLLTIMCVNTAWAKRPINQNWRGLAIKGYDAVAYFKLGKPLKGEAQFTHRWKDATWRFANAAHRDLFRKDPEKYAPQYGGY